jgi:two-component system, cell cycle response regulator
MSKEEPDTAVTPGGTALPASTASECLVVVYQRDGNAGKCIKLDDSTLRIGRDANNEIVLEDDGVSRRHARIERRGNRTVIMDVGSTNGTLLNEVELVGIAELKTGDRIKIGATVFKYLSASDLEAALHEQIYASTITDELTGLKNKRHLKDELAREFSRARRYNRALSLLMIDIDHFKVVNDEHGHPVGDITLRAVGSAVLACLGVDDTAARYGGEEIVVLLPEARLEHAASVAEKIRSAVAALVVSFREARVQVTVSIGCAEYEHADNSEEEVLRRADQRVYAAKAAGRNLVER